MKNIIFDISGVLISLTPKRLQKTLEESQCHEPAKSWQASWLEKIEGPIKGTVEILRSLHRNGYSLYAVTNWVDETFFSYMKDQPEYNFLNLFKDIVISGAEGVSKPDPKIYEILLTRNSLDPKDCIYIDDISTNLIPTKNMGMDTIKFNSSQQLLAELKTYNLKLS